jgi:hypothetical protein
MHIIFKVIDLLIILLVPLLFTNFVENENNNMILKFSVFSCNIVSLFWDLFIQQTS